MKDDNHDNREKGELQRATNCKEIERAGVTTCYRGGVRLQVHSLGLKTLLELNLLLQKSSLKPPI